MFKEFTVLFLGFIILAYGFRKLFRRNFKWFQRIAIGMILAAVIVNAVYNLMYVFPTFVYEGVAIGDSEENLFAYKKDGQFKDHILNTIIRNRCVMVDEDGKDYEQYFKIFGKESQFFDVSENAREKLKENGDDFTSIGGFAMVRQLHYAFPKWERRAEPDLYINIESLEGCDSLVVMVEEKNEMYDLYVMSETYYKEALNLEKVE